MKRRGKEMSHKRDLESLCFGGENKKKIIWANFARKDFITHAHFRVFG
jgi:hypothetical protein